MVAARATRSRPTPALSVTFEPRPGGRIFERTPAGDEHDWGEVLEWDPPRRLAYRWHLRQDRADATRVEISFAPAAEGTAVTIVHSDWQRLGQRERNERGWDGLLPHYVAACTGGPHAAADLRPRRPVGTRARARLHGAMEKPKTTAPPRHRRYPRFAQKPNDTEKSETSRRWPRAVSDRRVFPRG